MKKIIFYDDDFDHDSWMEALQKKIENLKEYELVSFRDVAKDDTIEIAILGTINQDFFKNYKNIKHIISLWAGVDRIIEHPGFREDIIVHRMIDPSLTQAMLEYAVGHVFYYHLEIERAYKQCQQNEWNVFNPAIAAHRCVGVMGLGEIGKNIAQKMHMLGFQVKGFSKSKKHECIFDTYDENEIKEFLSNVNILVMVLPNTKQTQHIMNAKTLRYLPRGSVIINIGRGAHVHEKDLCDAVDDGHIAFASLDVFDKEPLPEDHAFWQKKQIFITPHIAGISSPVTSCDHIFSILSCLKDGKISTVGLVDLQKRY